jgi:hypothetical protein
MRILGTTLVLLAILSACAMPRTPAYMAPDRYGTTALNARIMPGGLGGISFYLNQPAHVSIFEVRPGGGLSMIYPNYGDAGTFAHAGMNTVWRSMAHQRSRAWDGMFSFAGDWALGRSHMQQPRIYLLLASERPLRVSQYMHSWMPLRHDLGNAYFSANPYTLLEELARLVVPNHRSGEWAYDVYYDWPEPAYRDRTPMHVVVCRDGRGIAVPIHVTTCPSDRPTAPPAVVDSVGEPVEGRPQRPDRRRPGLDDVRAGDPADGGRTGVTRPERGVRTERPERVREPDTQPTREVERPQRTEPREDGRSARPERVRPDASEGRSREPAARPEPRERPSAPPTRSAEPRSAPQPQPAPRAEPPAPRSDAPTRAQPASPRSPEP